MDWILQIAKEYGPFVALVGWVLYTNWVREQRYLDVIQTLSEEVKERLTKIESAIRRKS